MKEPRVEQKPWWRRRLVADRTCRTGAQPAGAKTACAPDSLGTDRASEAGFSLVEVLSATTLLVVGTLTAVTLGLSCTNLQTRMRSQGTAHRAARDLLEQIRSIGPETALTQFTSTPTVTVQGLQATVTFPETVSTDNFGMAMTNEAALEDGFLPVRISINQDGQRYVLTTFVGVQ